MWLNVVTIIGLVASTIFALLLRDAWYAIRSRRWPGSPDRVLSSFVHVIDGTPIGYKPHVRYEYVVDGIRFESERIRFGAVNNCDYQAVVKEITGQTGLLDVKAYYDPKNPARSCLHVGVNEWTIAAPVGVGLIAAGCLYLGTSL